MIPNDRTPLLLDGIRIKSTQLVPPLVYSICYFITRPTNLQWQIMWCLLGFQHSLFHLLLSLLYLFFTFLIGLCHYPLSVNFSLVLNCSYCYFHCFTGVPCWLNCEWRALNKIWAKMVTRGDLCTPWNVETHSIIMIIILHRYSWKTSNQVTVYNKNIIQLTWIKSLANSLSSLDITGMILHSFPVQVKYCYVLSQHHVFLKTVFHIVVSAAENSISR